MKHINVMIKPASSLCDIRCSYCFYADVAASRKESHMGLMSRDSAAALVKNVFSELLAGDHITFAFQGGEPGLAGLDFFEFFVDEVKKAAALKVRVHYAFQTNGLMVDEDWCRFFVRNNFLVGLSLDGDAALHNRNRLDSKGKATHRRVMEAKKLFDRYGVEYNILCVLTSESSRRAQRIWDFILREKIRHIQFIPCLEPLYGQGQQPDNFEVSPAALTSEKFYNFYSALFPLWRKEAEKGNVIVIRLFEDLAALMLTRQPVTCGLSGRCSPQLIVEADGSVYPCDFYVLDEYRVSDLTKHSLREAFDAVVASGFLGNALQTPAHCADCAYKGWCGGGCKRMARAVYGENCGMKLFLDECLNDLMTCTRMILQRRDRP